MSINLENMEKIYGNEIVDTINSNIDIIQSNVKKMQALGFYDIEGLLERCVDVFLYFPNDFEYKINKLIKKLGENYVEKIENDISYLENL